MYKIIILDEAKEDIIETRSYYRKFLKSLSNRFSTDLKSAVAEIQTHPFAFGFRFDKFRTANLKIFPYQIHYVIDEPNSVIIIFAVLHAHQDPDFIKTRFYK